MEKKSDTSKSKDRVSRKDIYSQLSDAALRHRNYETETARWYTTILIAILGFILSAKFGETQSGIKLYLSGNLLRQGAFSFIVFHQETIVPDASLSPCHKGQCLRIHSFFLSYCSQRIISSASKETGRISFEIRAASLSAITVSL